MRPGKGGRFGPPAAALLAAAGAVLPAPLGVLAAWAQPEPVAREEGVPVPSGEELDRIQRAAFAYFIEQRARPSGLVYNTTESDAPASPTACGVALSILPIGIERGWISREAGQRYAEQLLETLGRIEDVHGFFYHFLDPRRGVRIWHSEVSLIDSAIFFAGAMTLAQYFPDTDVARMVNRLVDRADWSWFLDGEDTLKWAWRPETGFEDGGSMDAFSEAILAYLLGLGSSTHAIPPASWDAIRRPISQAGGHRMVYTPDGSLFAYLLPLAWFDLRDRHDAVMDYWTNARRAIEANIEFCEGHRDAYQTYREGLWGISAALGPHGYKPYGAAPADHVMHDGTVAPYVVAAAFPLVGQTAWETYRRMERASPKLWTRYGLGNALNLDLDYACPHSIALDQGLALLMIENMRSGLIWRLFQQHPVAQRAIAAAQFQPGRLDEPVPPPVTPGNPGASMAAPWLASPMTVDGDLADWQHPEAVTLTPVSRRNVESGYIRDERDASVQVLMGWREGLLYAAGAVLDDELVTGRSGEEIYQDDCLELFWDLDQNGFRFDGNPGDVQLGVAPGGPDGVRQVWLWGAHKRAPEEVQAVVRPTPGGFVFEIGVPLALLPELRPGRPVGFSVAYHDRDADGKAAKLQWSVDTSSVPGVLQFGTLRLDAAPGGE